jgi:hypothetical protein
MYSTGLAPHGSALSRHQALMNIAAGSIAPWMALTLARPGHTSAGQGPRIRALLPGGTGLFNWRTESHSIGVNYSLATDFIEADLDNRTTSTAKSTCGGKTMPADALQRNLQAG